MMNPLSVTKGRRDRERKWKKWEEKEEVEVRKKEKN